MVKENSTGSLSKLRLIWDTLGGHVARNTGWMVLAHGGKFLFQGVYFLLLARMLGVKDFGAFAGILAIVSIFSPLASWGSGSILIMNVARNKVSIGKYWGNVIFTILICGSLMMVLAYLVSHLFLPSRHLMLAIVLISAAEFYFGRLTEAGSQVFQALEKMGYTALINVIASFLRLLALSSFLICQVQLDLIVWTWCYLSIAVLSATFTFWLITVEIGWVQLKPRLFMNNIKEGFFFAIGVASKSVYTDIDKAVIVRLATLEAAGIYSAAYRVIILAFTPIQAFLAATYVRFFKYGQLGLEKGFQFANKVLLVTIPYGILISLALYFTAPWLPFLLGNDYVEAVQVIKILAIVPLIQTCYYPLADLLTGSGLQSFRSIVQISAMLFNLILNLVWVPVWGWKGAAWATIISETLIFITVTIFVIVNLSITNQRNMVGNDEER